MYDHDTVQVMTAVGLTGSKIRYWFDALCATYTGGDGGPPGDWDTFIENLTENGPDFDSSFDVSFVAAFRTAVESAGVNDPLGTLETMAGTGAEDLATAYPALLLEAEGAESEDPETLDWVTDAQRGRLAAEVGEPWPDAVRAKLTEVWPPWRESDAATLAGFLDDWMDTIVAESGLVAGTAEFAEAAEAPAVFETAVAVEPAAVNPLESLDWVTDQQRARLAGEVGTPWPDVVRAKLTEVWPPWRESDEATLAGFLDDWMDTIVAESGGAAAATVDPALSAFDEETQELLTSDEGQAAIDDLKRQVAEMLDSNPEYAGIDPARRQELILQAVAEKISA